MSIAIEEEHDALGEVVDDFCTARGALAAARAEYERPTVGLPPIWSEYAGQEWLGLSVSENFGGSGFGLLEAAVTVEQLGRHVAPGPILATIVAATILSHEGGPAAERWAPGLADGSVPGAFAANARVELGDRSYSGGVPAVMGAPAAGLFVLAVDDDVLVFSSSAPGVTVTERSDTDPTRRFGSLRLEGVPEDEVLVLAGAAGYARSVFQALLAAESAGVARACLDQARSYALVREQFGRVIGSFQAVKALLADLLVNAETAEAAAWKAAVSADDDPARFAYAAEAAVATASERAKTSAEMNIQLHGGIGFTWEHDAHLFYRRAITSYSVAGLDAARERLTRRALDGVVVPFAVSLPDEVEARRQGVRSFAERVAALPAEQQRAALIADGYLMPHWPAPWGIAAEPALQYLIQEELERAGVEKFDTMLVAFLVLTIVQMGTAEQAARWVPGALSGEAGWCQLFSEPGAGSDAAGISTKAERVDGGWVVTGQKVWTSSAHVSRWGMATVRTDPTASKHGGITMLGIDLTSPGVDIRPLRQITGDSDFNEVFLDGVFVPDENVIGEVGGGWAVARATLGNERVTLGSGAGYGPQAADVLELVRRQGSPGEHTLWDIGRFLADELALRTLNFRRTERTMRGGPSPQDGLVTKLMGSRFGQESATLYLSLAGESAVYFEGEARDAVHTQLRTRRLTIAGGTTEIARGQIAERILGMPREPGLSR